MNAHLASARGRVVLPLLLALSLAGLLAGAGWHTTRAASKARGPARSCYDCHADAKKEYQKKYVHPDVAKENCLACHDSHGFSQKLVLKKPMPELCIGCHGELQKAAADRKSVV